MFTITQAGYFEDNLEKISVIPEIEQWNSSPNSYITELRYAKEKIWLTRSDVGAICVDCDLMAISLYPKKSLDIEKFQKFVIHYWLPMAYQVCGTQVLHASALVNLNTHRILAICGDSGCGKSTFGFGMGKRAGWRQIADDRLAFSINNGKAVPILIPDTIKLRTPSANYFGEEPYQGEPLEWIEGDLEIKNIIFLTQSQNEEQQLSAPFEITPITRTDSYEFLLKQAFALTPALQELNKKMIENYLVLANQAQSYKLTYTLDFGILDKIYDAIEDILV